MKSFYFLFIFAHLVTQISCAQSRELIQKGYAFIQPSFRGTVLKDDQGREQGQGVDTLRFIFLETRSGVKFTIDSVIYGSTVYMASVFAVDKVPVIPGKTGSGKEIILLPRAGNQLLKLELNYSHNEKFSNQGKGILIKGKNGKRPFRYWIGRQTALMPEQHY